MSQEQSLQDLLSRLRSGDPRAASEIFTQFAHRLIGLAHNRLAKLVRAKEDPEDVVQSVFRSFFARQATGQFSFSGWNDMWNLLALITLRKCGQRIEHYRAACRDVAREARPELTSDDSLASWGLLARAPDPSEAAVLVETVENLLQSLAERDRTILELYMQGQTVPEISDHLRCAERTIERGLKRIRQKLEGMSTAP